MRENPISVECLFSMTLLPGGDAVSQAHHHRVRRHGRGGIQNEHSGAQAEAWCLLIHADASLSPSSEQALN